MRAPQRFGDDRVDQAQPVQVLGGIAPPEPPSPTMVAS
jgi:hypothetical protein